MNTCMEDVLHDIRCNTGDEEYSQFLKCLRELVGNKNSDDLTKEEVCKSWKNFIERG